MKILVIQQKMIGDVLTSSILFKALRENYPEAELHYLIFPHTEPVIRNNPYIDKIITYPINKSFFFKYTRFVSKIKQEQYEVVIDVYSKIGTSILSSVSDAKYRIGYEKWYTRYFYTHTYTYSKTPKTKAGLAIENRLMLLDPLPGKFPSEVKPVIYLSTSEIGRAKERMKKAGIRFEKPIYMIGVLGSGKKKTYPLSYMAQIIDHLAYIPDAQFLFNYIPSQKKETEELLHLCQPHTQKKIYFDLYGKDLREFVALTSLCDALIGNEGGAVNMAKAVKTPTFSIFSPQIDKKAWSLYEDNKNFGVHLKDYRPEIFTADLKITDQIETLYQAFKPELIIPDLDIFIQNLDQERTSDS